MATAALTNLLAASLGTSTPPTFTLDLSLPARDRWAGALALVAAEHPWDASWLPIFAEHNASLFDHIKFFFEAVADDDAAVYGEAILNLAHAQPYVASREAFKREVKEKCERQKAAKSVVKLEVSVSSVRPVAT